MPLTFRFFLLLLLPTLALPGQAVSDSLVRADERMLEQARDLPADSLYRFLAPYLAQRYRSGNWTQNLAEGYHRIAYKFQQVGNNLTGLAYVDTALLIRPELPDTEHIQFARSYFIKSALLEQMNAYQLATDWAERAVAELNVGATAGEQHDELTIMLGYYPQHSARVALQNYDFDLTERRLAQAASVLETYPDEITAFDILIDRGNMNVRKEDFAAAIAAYDEVLEIALAYDDQYYARIARVNLGLSHSQLGNYPAADRLFAALERDFAAVPSPERDNEYHSHLGNFYGEQLKHQRRTGRVQTADQLVEKGLEALRYEFPNGLGGARGELLTAAAEISAQAGEVSRTDSLLRAAFASLVEDYDPNGPNFLPALNGRPLYGQQELLAALATARDLARQERSVPGLRRALATSQTIDTLLRRNRQQFNLTGSFGQFLRQQRHHYATAVAIALELYRTTGEAEALTEAYRFVATEKGNLLRRYLTGPDLARNFGVPDSLVRHKRRLELAALTLESAITNTPETKTLRDSLLSLNTQLQTLKTELEAGYPAFALALQGYAPLDPINISQQLTPDQQLLEFFLTPDSVYVFNITQAAGLTVEVRPRPPNLDFLISGVVDGTAEGNAAYEQLLAGLPAPGIRRLQFIPDGQLWNLPFHSLRLPDGRFLIEEYAVSYAYAAPLLFDAGQRQNAAVELANFRGFGIDYTDLVRRLTTPGSRQAASLRNLGPLPFASLEVAHAAEKTGGEPLLNQAATKERFLEEAAGADVLHLAMHGLLAPDPMESALVFHSATDSTYALLTMAEVLSQRLPVELAILSACHTGQGPIATAEGMQSIGRAFTAAGARSTIASTWAANDQATHDILAVFYDRIVAGTSRDVALQEAVVHYLREGTTADRQPLNWANLTLLGEAGPVQKPFRLPWWSYLLGAGLLFSGIGWIRNRKQ
ncbi:MAG: CHAT domain-containing protein [Bacteroidota bacterium]